MHLEALEHRSYPENSRFLSCIPRAAKGIQSPASRAREPSFPDRCLPTRTCQGRVPPQPPSVVSKSSTPKRLKNSLGRPARIPTPCPHPFLSLHRMIIFLSSSFVGIREKHTSQNQPLPFLCNSIPFPPPFTLIEQANTVNGEAEDRLMVVLLGSLRLRPAPFRLCLDR